MRGDEVGLGGVEKTRVGRKDPMAATTDHMPISGVAKMFQDTSDCHLVGAVVVKAKAVEDGCGGDSTIWREYGADLIDAEDCGRLDPFTVAHGGIGGQASVGRNASGAKAAVKG